MTIDARNPDQLFDGVTALTFDCYGTLIDWETGLLRGLTSVGESHDCRPPPEQLLERYAVHEAMWEAGPYLPYREVLERSMAGVCESYGFEPTELELAEFGRSVATWPPFADSGPALRRLAGRFRLGVITNCDDDLFAESARQLGIEFEWVVSAQQAGTYKPSRLPFEIALRRIGLPGDAVVHVAQSLYHDHVPAIALGLRTVWLNRRHGRVGFGATPPATATPRLVVPDMSTLADICVGRSASDGGRA